MHIIIIFAQVYFIPRRVLKLAKWECMSGLVIIITIFVPQEAQIPGLKTRNKNKLVWLNVGIVLTCKSLVKEDGINIITSFS